MSILRNLPGMTATLLPGYFALIMATGIVSIACDMLDLRGLALVLLGVNWAAFVVLAGLTIARAIFYPQRLLSDLADHQRAPGFFTVAAAICVLGSQDVELLGATGIGLGLWWLGLILWGGISYAVFAVMAVRRVKPTLADGIDGIWLVAIVSTQAVVTLRGLIDTGTAPPEVIQFLVMAMFVGGGMLYIALIPLIFYRLIFAPLRHEAFRPPYWISMGAVAITTLAGSILIMRADVWPLLTPFLPFLTGVTLACWAMASWWIPLLVLLTGWRSVCARGRFGYNPAIWAMVFPLGMYAACTHAFASAMGYSFLNPVAHIAIWVALAAWGLGMLGLLRHLGRAAFAPAV